MYTHTAEKTEESIDRHKIQINMLAHNSYLSNYHGKDGLNYRARTIQLMNYLTFRLTTDHVRQTVVPQFCKGPRKFPLPGGVHTAMTQDRKSPR